MVIGYSRVPDPPARMMPLISPPDPASVNSVAARAEARSPWRNTEVTWSCTTRNAAASSVFLLGHHHTVAHVHPPGTAAVVANDCAHSRSASCPWPAPLRVAELDVVAGNLNQGVEVLLVKRVMPREHGRDLRSGHGRESYATQNGVRSSQASQTSVSPKTSTPSSVTVRLSHDRQQEVGRRAREERRRPCRGRGSRTHRPRR